MNETVSLKKALSIMDLKNEKGEAIPFNISFRTLNRKAKTGGRLVSYEGAKLLVSGPSKSHKSRLQDLTAPPKPKKNPNHFQNRTRNIEQANGNISKIHIRLIDSINGQKVVY